MADGRFALQYHVESLHTNKHRRFSFNAHSLLELQQWQHELRTELIKLLRLENRTRIPVQAEKLQTIDQGSYTEEKYALDVGEEVKAPMYILVPNSQPPFKPILVFHGHNPSVQYILGNYPNEEISEERRSKDNDYAQALAQRGYLVCAIEQRGFGERITEQMHDSSVPWSCRHLAFEYMLQGRNLMGERCWDGICAINYLETREDVVQGILGCTGNSGGGTTTSWLSAIEDRITVSVPSCSFCSFKDSILAIDHCECNYVPGILELVEMGDLAGMIAPRPFCAIAGEHDPLFPIYAVREAYETVRQAYELHGASEKCSLAVHPGGHAYNHTLSQEWFSRWL